MPLKFKQSLNEGGEVKEAIRRRLTEDEHHTLTDKEIDVRIAQYLVADNIDSRPQLIPGNPLFSDSWRTLTKDQKLLSGMLNGRIGTIEEQILNTSRETFGLLSEIQQQALTLDSQITEEEIKNLHGYTAVHHNSFVRGIDFGLSSESQDWLVDGKTGLPFLQGNTANIIPSTGMTLPIRERVDAPIIDVVLVGEETDVGDTRKPIIANSPRNLLHQGKVFRYVIACREFDDTTRKYNKRKSVITLLLNLANIQLINHLVLKPVGQSQVTVEELSYINEAGEEILLTQEILSAETNLTVVFAPTRTKWLKVKLSQFAPITKTHHDLKDLRVSSLNDVLRGVGFTHLLHESVEKIQGRIFDFSLESIKVGLLMYEALGVFRSKGLKVRSPRALTISNIASRIQTDIPIGEYGVDFQLPDGTVLNEFYTGITLKDRGGNILLRDLIPVPSSYPIQREYLPLIGSKSKLLFFPDMTWNISKTRVISLVDDGSLGTATTEVPHGLPVGSPTTVVVLGPEDHPFNGEVTITPVDALTFTIDTTASSEDYSFTENTLPRVYFYLLDQQQSPLDVSMNDTVLDIGTDYEISIDGGITFSKTFPRGSDYVAALRLARSGRCVVKILRPQLDKFYWVQYRPLKTQLLGGSDLVRMRGGRVVFNKSLKGSRGRISTIIVSRADSANPYVSPVMQSYTLKVREHVS
jgi:hypothetical protein